MEQCQNADGNLEPLFSGAKAHNSRECYENSLELYSCSPWGRKESDKTEHSHMQYGAAAL